MPKLPERFGLNLPDPLAGNIKLLADFLQGMIPSIPKSETELQDLLFPLRQCLQHLLGLAA